MKWREGRVINRIAIPVTRRCNRVCPECPARGDSQTPVEELKWVGKMLGPIGKIELTGGEPSLHPDFEEISKSCHDWFDCKDIMLLTNGSIPDSKLPLLLNYDRVYITHYTNEFGIRHHAQPNTGDVNRVEDYLKKNGKKFWTQRMDKHTPIGSPPYTGIPACGYDRGDSVGYGQGRIYGCCVAFWLSDKGDSIPLTRDWRDHLSEVTTPCATCFFTGEKR